MSRPAAVPRLTRRTLLAGTAGLGIAATSRRQAKARPASRLSRGLNLSHWFAQSQRGYGPEHLQTFVGDRRLDEIAATGFTHVRLGAEPAALFSDVTGGNHLVPAVIDRLEEALERIAARGLTVVLDLHPVGQSKQVLLKTEGADALVARWSGLARQLAGRSGAGLVLEILNEPEPVTGEDWWRLQERVLRAIRAAGAAGLVIANGGGWSGIDDLVARRAYGDPDVVYTIHHYAPLLFTHQGADWTWDVARTIERLPWPIARDDAGRAAAAATPDERARDFLRAEIAGGRFTAEAIDSELSRAAAWAGADGASIYVGEFGTYARTAPRAARLAWLQASREGFERRGFGWAVWDSSPSFGLLSGDGPDGRFDSACLEALGLSA